MSSLKPVVSCVHTSLGHLLHPLCAAQPLWRRVANIALPVFVLLAGIYYYISSRTSHYPPVALRRLRFQSLNGHSLEGQRAFQKAIELLKSTKDLKPGVYTKRDGSHFENGPQDINIRYLVSAFSGKAEKLIETLRSASGTDDPWQDEKNMDSALQVMQLGYVLSCASLKDLLEKKEVNGYSSTIEAGALLASPECHAKYAISRCLVMYHYIRRAVRIDGDNRLLLPQTPLDYCQRFYQQGTSHYCIRTLYNELLEKLEQIPGLLMPPDMARFQPDNTLESYCSVNKVFMH